MEDKSKDIQRPKLTLKAAKSIAMQELGTAAGLKAHKSNDAENQRYEMQLGRHTVVIENEVGGWGTASIAYGAQRTTYDIENLERNDLLTEADLVVTCRMLLRDTAGWGRQALFEAMLKECGGEDGCRQLLHDAAQAMEDELA